MIDYSLLKKGKDGRLTSKSLMTFLRYCNSGTEVWDAWWDLTHDEELTTEYPMSWKIFHKGLIEAYCQGKMSQSEGREMFQEVYEYWYDYASKDEKKFYDSIETDENGCVTVYRGCSKAELDNEECGISWTTDRAIAEFFAFRFADMKGYDGGVVIKAKVHKGAIASVITDRDEDEVILVDWVDYEIVTDKPTEFYDQYQERRKDEIRKLCNLK